MPDRPSPSHPVFAMRMPADVRAALEVAARRELRPVTNLALKIIVDALTERGDLPGAPTAPPARTPRRSASTRRRK